MDCSKERLTALACAGDRAAIEEVTRCYLGNLLAVGRWACGDSTAAEDAVQDGLLTATERLEDFRGEGSFEGWLRSIVIHACARQRRRQTTLPLSGAEAELEEPSPEIATFHRQLADELIEALAGLSEEDRAAVLMTQVEGRTSAEVAEELEVSAPTLRKRLSRSRTRLRERLGHFLR